MKHRLISPYKSFGYNENLADSELSMNSREIKILAATPNFRDEIAHLLWVQLQEHAISISEEKLQGAVDGVLENPARGALWVALKNERPVGVAYISYIWAMEHGGKSAWLEELFVLPEFRELGYGTLILDVVMQAVRASGCAAIDLEVEAGHGRVESLYSRNGFSKLSRSRWVKSMQENV